VAQGGAPQADRQLPTGEEIFLDHIGHFVPDREAAAGALARAGFAPAPVSIQTSPAPAGGAPQLTGTGNITAMLTRGYIEVLFKTADTPLGRELDAAVARYSGVHLAALAVADAAAAHRRLAAGGFRMRPLVEMQRPVSVDVVPDTAASASPPPCGEGLGAGVARAGTTAPHGTTPLPIPPPPPGRLRPSSTGYGGREESAVAAFTIARLEPGEMPEGRIQILMHRTEHLVWQPRWLAHPNGALGLTGVVIAVADVNEAADRFVRFTRRPARPSATGQTIALDRGRLELMSAAALSDLLPELPLPSLPFIAAYCISVHSVEVTESLLVQNRLKVRRSGQELVAVFPRELGCGAWLFRAAGDPQ
jgi:hypothetical protein